MKYYQETDQAVCEELGTSENGLSQKQAQESLKKYGPNQLTQAEQEPWYMVFLGQFKDLLVLVLIAAGIISALTGEVVSTIVIFVVITINAILGTVQTLQARKSLNALKKLSQSHVKVIRDGKMSEIPSGDLAVGDVVYVEAGDVVEGDGRLFAVSSLAVNESALTGEALPQEKTTAPIDHECQINDQTNMVFSSGQVTNGTGKYIVTATGMNTQIGKIAAMIDNAQERKTPLQLSLDDFSKKLTLYIAILCAALCVIHVVFRGESIVDALMISVALAVAAIPEALTSIVTIVLSIATRKMVKEHAIMKQLDATESLGCVSVICSDKTGTLTQNKMKVVEIYTSMNPHYPDEMSAGKDYAQNILLKACALCNNAVIDEAEGTALGDPTEIALLDLYNAYKHKNEDYEIFSQRLDELPFDSDRKMMSVNSENHLYTKGAVDNLLDRCTMILDHDKKRPITQEDKDVILAWNDSCARNGLRVLGFAYKPFEPKTLTLDDENGLTFVGMVAEQDPPRPESAEAVKMCQTAGIKPIMITGDHAVTATAIAKKIGIWHDGDLTINGNDLAKMSNDELNSVLDKATVYARVAPEHKIRIVKAWQDRGAVVAMTGDGVNDAPALKQSDIGVAMGITGTEVSKEAAKMVLTDDNFHTIVKAVVTGRNVYNNIKNAIIYLLSGNLGAVIMVIAATLLFLPNPFAAIHLLFINLITDSLPAIAIGTEEGSDNVLHQKPRPLNESILNKDVVWEIILEGFFIFLGTLAAYLYGLQTSAGLASTMAFATLCVARLLHGFSSRQNVPLWRMGINWFSIGAFVIGFGLLMLILYVPALQGLFQVTPLSQKDLAVILGSAFVTFVLVQIYKWASTLIKSK